MIINSKIKIFCLLFFVSFIFSLTINAQTSDIEDAKYVEVFLLPRTGSFSEGSTFEVPILINTNAASVNGINIKINFDKDYLLIVEPSGGKSIVGFWAESPSYDNTLGTVNYIGTIPGGIVTESGLIATITFKALSYGQAQISISPASKISLNDGLQTNAVLDLGRAEYNILKKLSEGVSVFSETHSSQVKWYNNNSPVVSWQRDAGVDGFSFELDNKPFTVPDNIINSNETTKSFENLTDGLWYFHIKANKNGAWGTTGHFLLKIDTVPPAEFTPKVNNFLASAILSGRTLVSFFTTDNLSGVDHYEVGTIDENQPISQAPVFFEAGSPFQVPILENSILKVIVRAFDKAGNTREGYLEVGPPFMIWKFVKNNLLLLVVLFVILIILLAYYLMKYKINRLKNPSTFSTLESDIKNYLYKRKEVQERDIIEKEKIEILEKDLNEIKAEIDKEIKDEK